jgi:hypothetical protein
MSEKYLSIFKHMELLNQNKHCCNICNVKNLNLCVGAWTQNNIDIILLGICGKYKLL